MQLRLFRVADPCYIAVQLETGEGHGRLLVCPFDSTIEQIADQSTCERSEIDRIAVGFARENEFRPSNLRFDPQGMADFVVMAKGEPARVVVHVTRDARGVDESFVRLLLEGIDGATRLYLVTAPETIEHLPERIILTAGTAVAVEGISLQRAPVSSFDALAITVWDSLTGSCVKLRKAETAPRLLRLQKRGPTT